LPHVKFAHSRFLLLVCILLVSVAVFAEPTATLRGRVVDESGAVLVGASVTLFGAGGNPLAAATTDGEGRFVLSGVAPGRYELVARQPGLESTSAAVDATATEPAEFVLTLRVGALSSSVTVTASRGLPEDAVSVPNGTSVVGPEQKQTRPALILPQLLREEPGVQVQQTTSHQGAILIRGLTGQQVLHLIDGVRYNNSTFRPGPNQYLATVDPSFVERLEVSRGPNSIMLWLGSTSGTARLR